MAAEVEREEAVSRFRYTLILPPQLERHRSVQIARLERSPARTTPSKTLEFAPGGIELRVSGEESLSVHRNNRVTKHALLGTRKRKEPDDVTTDPDRRPAVGKTTCGRALTVECDRVVDIDVDDMRKLIVAELGRNRWETSSHGVLGGLDQVPT